MLPNRARVLLRHLCILVLALASAWPVPLLGQEREGSEEDNARRRLEFFRLQRAFPFAEIPQGALQAARAAVERRWPEISALREPGMQRTWSPIGPDVIPENSLGSAGRLVSIAVHPRDPNTIYIGAAQGGVWKTTNRGASWTPLTDGECSLAMGSVALDPINPDIVYAGTGEQHFSGDSYYGCGVLRSVDGGRSWSQLARSDFGSGTNGGARISKVVVDAVSAGTVSGTTVYAATDRGVFRSPDSGSSWQRTLPHPSSDLVADPSNSAVLYAAVGTAYSNSEAGVYRSADGGLTWSRLAAGFPTTSVGRINLAISPSDPTVLYAAVQHAFGTTGGGRLLGVWRTGNAGSSWQQVGASGASCGGQCWYDLVIAVHPRDANTVYFGGIGFYKSTNGGASFSYTGGGIHVDQHAIAFDPSNPEVVYVGNDGGVYRTENGGFTWTSLNTNLAITQFYAGISVSAAPVLAALGGTQDNGTLRFDGLPSWQWVLGGDGGWTAIDPRDPKVAYAETQWGSGFSGPRRSDGGPFQQKVNGIDLSDPGIFIPPLVMDASNPSTLYFGTNRLYRTSDRGEWWSVVPGTEVSGARVSAIATAATDPRVVYVGYTTGKLRASSDGGATWVDGAGLPQRYIADVAVSRQDARTAYVAVAGFLTSHVFRTRDGGTTWQDATNDLPDVPALSVAVDPVDDRMVVLGTDLGVFRSLDGGDSWLPYNDGMPNVAVYDVTFHPTTRALVAATHGRGMFVAGAQTLSALFVTPDQPAVTAGGETRLRATGYTGLGDEVALTPTWSSADPRIATVDAGGLVRGVRLGAVDITASAEGLAATVRLVVGPAALAAAADSVHFSSLADTAAVQVKAFDQAGAELSGGVFQWTSLDPSVVGVTADGRLHSLRNGSGSAIVRSGVAADTVRFVVRQVVARIASSGPPAAVLVGEAVQLVAEAQDARGVRVQDRTPVWSVADTAVATVTGSGKLTGVVPGTTTLRAASGAVARDFTVRVAPPGRLEVSARSVASSSVSPLRGELRPMLSVGLRAAGEEAIRVAVLGFDVEGADAAAELVLVADRNGNGAADPDEKAVAASRVRLVAGEPLRVLLQVEDLRVEPAESFGLVAALRSGGSPPHGSVSRLTFVPEETRSVGVRSGQLNQLEQPRLPVASEPSRTTVLRADEVIALSENPVRTGRLVISFKVRPTVAAIYTVTGARVADLGGRAEGDGLRVVWDLTNEQGSTVAPGVYFLIADVEGQAVRQKLIVASDGREEDL